MTYSDKNKQNAQRIFIEERIIDAIAQLEIHVDQASFGNIRKEISKSGRYVSKKYLARHLRQLREWKIIEYVKRGYRLAAKFGAGRILRQKLKKPQSERNLKLNSSKTRVHKGLKIQDKLPENYMVHFFLFVFARSQNFRAILLTHVCTLVQKIRYKNFRHSKT